MEQQEVDKLIKDFQVTVSKPLEFLSKDLSTLRTGRANASMLDNIKVDHYGDMVSLEQVSTISIPESRMIVISVWEKPMIFEIETKIRESNLGINPVVDGTKIKLPVPPLTEELRKDLVKKATEYAEKAKIAIRQVRKNMLDKLKDLQKTKMISEDLFKLESEHVEKIVKNAISESEVILDKKTKELMNI